MSAGRRCGRLVAWVWLVFAPLACSGSKPPNVLLITVDTLRADHLGSYGFELDATPHLDELAAHSVVFDRAIAASSATAPSHASIMTSRYPREHTIGWHNGDTRLEGETTLAERFRDAGYDTAGFVGNVVLQARFGFDRGFAHYDDQLPSQEPNRPLVFERIARDTTLRVEQWLETARAPFFLWVHYQDPHGPYTPPPGYAGHFDSPPAPDEPALPVLHDDLGGGGIPAYQALPGLSRASQYRERYADEIYYADDWIGQLLRSVDARSAGRGTIVLFTADHGEDLGDFGRYFVHDVSGLPPEAHVPLMIRAPGLAPGRRGETVGHVDIEPTLLELAGLPVPEGLSGIALGPALRAGRPLPERLLYCDIGLEVDAYRAGELIRVLPAYPDAERPPQPPQRWWRHPWHGGEVEPALPVDPDTRAQIEAYLNRVVAPVPAGPPSPEDLERLRALGYVR